MVGLAGVKRSFRGASGATSGEVPGCEVGPMERGVEGVLGIGREMERYLHCIESNVPEERQAAPGTLNRRPSGAIPFRGW